MQTLYLYTNGKQYCLHYKAYLPGFVACHSATSHEMLAYLQKNFVPHFGTDFTSKVNAILVNFFGFIDKAVPLSMHIDV